MKAMIMAAGLGKRLQPLTLNTPKPLIKVGSKSLLIRQIERLQNIGVQDFTINISYLAEQIRAELYQLHPGLNIKLIEEPFPYGTGGALLNARPHLGDEPFILCNADLFTDIDLTQMPQATDAAHLIGVPNPTHNLDGDFSLQKQLVSIAKQNNQFTWSGISLINPKILQGHEHQNYPCNLWEIILKPLITASRVTAHVDDSMWMDVGTVERLELAREALKEEN